MKQVPKEHLVAYAVKGSMHQLITQDNMLNLDGWEIVTSYPTNVREIKLSDIAGTKFDKDYILRHLEAEEFSYKGFKLCVIGEHQTYLDVGENEDCELITKRVPVLLAQQNKDKIQFGDNCWIEIVEDEDFYKEYDLFGSLKEAMNFIDKLNKEGK